MGMLPRTLLASFLFLGCGAELTDLHRAELAEVNCGGVSTSCSHEGTRIVDFEGAFLETHTCVEGVDGGSPRWGPERGETVSTRPLTEGQLKRVRTALEGLSVTQTQIDTLDGPMSTVTLTGKTVKTMSPGATCGPQSYLKIVSGFPALLVTFAAL